MAHDELDSIFASALTTGDGGGAPAAVVGDAGGEFSFEGLLSELDAELAPSPAVATAPAPAPPTAPSSAPAIVAERPPSEDGGGGELDDLFSAAPAAPAAAPPAAPAPAPAVTDASLISEYLSQRSFSDRAAAYAALLPELPVDQPVIGIREYGWGDPTRRLPTIEAYAARYVDEVQRHQPTGAIALAGYSLGGLLAYEMARLLVARGRRVEVVLLLDAAPVAAPGDPAHQAESSLSKLRRRLARDGATGVARGIGRLVRRRWQRWYQHPAEARRTQRALRAATRAGVEPDLLLLGLLSEHFGHGLRLAYRPERYDGRVVHCRATGVDPDFPLGDYRYRWRRVVDDLTMVEVPGNHSREGSMFTPPHVEVLGARVSEVLDTILKGDR